MPERQPATSPPPRPLTPGAGAGERRETARGHSSTAAWAGYAAVVWSLVFAAVSFYWAAGGTAGAATIGPAIAEPVLRREPGWVALMWATGALKVAGALLAPALARRWGGPLPRRLLRLAGWSAGIIMAGYEGAASLIQHGLMVSGVIDTPEGLGTAAARWHLLAWDPWWLLGGLLFIVAVRAAGRAVTAVPPRHGQAVRDPNGL
jgi:hypothetical protein